MGKKRKVPGINGSSSADIAFMLLLFFLLTTSMDTDMGLAQKLLIEIGRASCRERV